MAGVPNAERAVAVATVDASSSAPRSAIGTAMASVPDIVHESAVAVASARSAVGTAVVSVPTTLHEPAVAVATADTSASAPVLLLLLPPAHSLRYMSLPSLLRPQMLRRRRLAVLLLLWRAYPMLYMRLPWLLRSQKVFHQRLAIPFLLLWRAQTLRYMSLWFFLRSQMFCSSTSASLCWYCRGKRTPCCA